MVMPFGKHKGKDLEVLPSGYLRWVAENVEGQDVLVCEVEDELAYRDDHNGHFEEERSSKILRRP